MSEKQDIQIDDTAFLTAAFRSSNVDLSKDKYAKLWHNPKTSQWIEKYLKLVSSEEAQAHCLRNRYFYDTIKAAIEKQEIEVLINFGSGLSMYPFLFDERLINIEIDQKNVINYKKQQLEKWQSKKVLPEREIHFIGLDFSDDYQDKVQRKIEEIKAGRPCFILIEGVLFFLNRQITKKLFEFFDAVQSTNDYIGSVSFQDSLKEKKAFHNLLEYLNSTVNKNSSTSYQSIPDSFYHKLKNYRLIDHQDYFTLSKKYDNRIRQSTDLILNENLYLLQKE